MKYEVVYYGVWYIAHSPFFYPVGAGVACCGEHETRRACTCGPRKVIQNVNKCIITFTSRHIFSVCYVRFTNCFLSSVFFPIFCLCYIFISFLVPMW